MTLLSASSTDCAKPDPIVKGLRLTQQAREIAKCCFNGDCEKAIKLYLEAIDLFDKNGYMSGVAKVSCLLGDLYKKLSKFDSAIKVYQHGLKKLPRQDTPKNLAIKGDLWNGLGVTYLLRGMHKEALKYFSKSLKLWRKTKNHVKVVHTLINIGILYKNDGMYDKADEYYTKALAIKGDLKGRGRILCNRAVLLAYRGKYREALDTLKDALKIAIRLKNPEGKSAVLANIGEIHRLLGDRTKALGFFEKDLAICKLG
jgi:tetratricopeptide (TPR) repeat protein